MPLLKTHIVPHPPLIVPTVGRGREQDVAKTIAAYRQIAESVAADRPDLIIFITPHGKSYDDYIHISPNASATGDLSAFGAPETQFSTVYDEVFIKHLEIIAAQMKIPAGTLGGQGAEALDHGVMVPMYFINCVYTDYKSVRISLSGLSYAAHYRLGQCIQHTLNGLDRRAVIIASGDMSHKLTAEGPYGYAPEGPAFDKAMCDAMQNGDFLSFLTYEPALSEAAAECGLRSFIMMAGALDGLDVTPAFYNYEGSYGVGYAICSFTPGTENPERKMLPPFSRFQEEKLARIRANEDAYVQLARQSLETYINTGEILSCPEHLPADMLTQRAGTFVSIKKDGKLRGCIGTTTAYRTHVAEEIIHNAISAGTKDPRFESITADELPALVYSVDVLSPAEPINSKDELDVKKYGVIVSNGHKRGLLLPNLDGVDNVEQQLAIALQKAGIASTEAFKAARFAVVRHQ